MEEGPAIFSFSFSSSSFSSSSVSSPQLPGPDPSGHSWTSTASVRAQWALPDLNPQGSIAVDFPASMIDDVSRNKAELMPEQACRTLCQSACPPLSGQSVNATCALPYSKSPFRAGITQSREILWMFFHPLVGQLIPLVLCFGFCFYCGFCCCFCFCFCFGFSFCASSYLVTCHAPFDSYPLIVIECGWEKIVEEGASHSNVAYRSMPFESHPRA